MLENGFYIKPYDLCVANKTINSKQFTCIWHADDLKLSHKDPQEVTNMITWFKSNFEDDGIKQSFNFKRKMTQIPWNVS